MEISPLAGHNVYPGEDVPAGGVVAGVGTVQGVNCMLVANDSTYDQDYDWKDEDVLIENSVKGGTYYPITVKKHLRAQAIAQENRMLPILHLSLHCESDCSRASVYISC